MLPAFKIATNEMLLGILHFSPSMQPHFACILPYITIVHSDSDIHHIHFYMHENALNK